MALFGALLLGALWAVMGPSGPPAAPVALSRAKTPIVASAQHFPFPEAPKLRLRRLLLGAGGQLTFGHNELELQFTHVFP